MAIFNSYARVAGEITMFKDCKSSVNGSSIAMLTYWRPWHEKPELPSPRPKHRWSVAYGWQTAKRGRFKWQGKNHGKKKFWLTESSKSINNTIIFSYLQNNLEMDWIGYEGEFSVAVCLEIIWNDMCSRIPKWILRHHQVDNLLDLKHAISASNGLSARPHDFRHPNRRDCPYVINLRTSMYLDHVLSAMVLSNKFIALGFWHVLTISGGWTKQALTVPTSSNTQIEPQILPIVASELG